MTQTKATQPSLPLNPFLVIWSMPFIMTQAWVAACLCTTSRKDVLERNTDKGQIPVPPILQDSNDHELFA